MSDLVERLKRGWHGMAVITLGGVRHLEICLEAADRIEALEDLVRNSTFEWASDWDLFDSVCSQEQPVDYAKPE